MILIEELLGLLVFPDVLSNLYDNFYKFIGNS